jgi:phage-related protein (TIGR01555 family)
VPRVEIKRKQPTIEKKPVKASALDAFVNMLTRQGVGMPNAENATSYVMTRMTQNYSLLIALYRENWIARKIIDVPAEDMTKAWINITSDMTPEMQDSIDRLERNTGVRAKIAEGLGLARLFGGAGGLIMIDGMDEDGLMEPLNLDSIMPGSFRGLMILDRWSGIYPDIEIEDDISDPEFGKPKYYEITNAATSKSYMVHHSHLLRFEGRALPMWEQMSTQMWGESEIEIVYEELRKRDNASANLAGLIFRANINVMKMEGLGQMLGFGDVQAQSDLYATMQAQSQLLNNFSMYAIDAKDDFQSIQNTTFSGLNDIYESFMLDVCGAAEMPMTKLFGRSPAGLNSTGEGDLQNYYDGISSKQEKYARSPLQKLLPVMFMSQFGFVPDDINFRFNSPRTPSESELAELVDKKAGTIVEVHKEGLISDKIAMKELQTMGQSTGMFTNITDEDIDKADDTLGMGDVPGFGMNSPFGDPTDPKKQPGDEPA